MGSTIFNGIGCLIIWIVIGLFAFGMGFLNEKKNFNGGKCTKCGSDLYLFDFDSQGGRGYICGKCNDTVWVSHKSVDADYLRPVDEEEKEDE